MTSQKPAILVSIFLVFLPFLSIAAEIGCKTAPDTYCGEHGTCNHYSICNCDELWEGEFCENRKNKHFLFVDGQVDRNFWCEHFEWGAESWGCGFPCGFVCGHCPSCHSTLLRKINKNSSKISLRGTGRNYICGIQSKIKGVIAILEERIPSGS